MRIGEFREEVSSFHRPGPATEEARGYCPTKKVPSHVAKIDNNNGIIYLIRVNKKHDNGPRSL